MRVLFITSTRIGDAVMSTGVLSALVARYPEATFTIACGPLAAPLFAAVPRLDRVIVVRKQPFDWHWIKLWRELRPIAWDVIVDLRRSLIAYTLRARERHVLGPADPTKPRVATLPAVIGIATPLEPHVFTARSHREYAEVVIPDGGRVLGLGPVASMPSKTWPTTYFAALARKLTAPGGLCDGWRVAAFGGPGDEGAVAEVLEAVPLANRLSVVAEPDLLIVHAALARCTAFVGNDSGLSHLAAAAGVPTLAVFGGTYPERYGPWGRDCGTVSSPDPNDLSRLAPETVAGALAELLHRKAERAS